MVVRTRHVHILGVTWCAGSYWSTAPGRRTDLAPGGVQQRGDGRVPRRARRSRLRAVRDLLGGAVRPGLGDLRCRPAEPAAGAGGAHDAARSIGPLLPADQTASPPVRLDAPSGRSSSRPASRRRPDRAGYQNRRSERTEYPRVPTFSGCSSIWRSSNGSTSSARTSATGEPPCDRPWKTPSTACSPTTARHPPRADRRIRQPLTNPPPARSAHPDAPNRRTVRRGSPTICEHLAPMRPRYSLQSGKLAPWSSRPKSISLSLT